MKKIITLVCCLLMVAAIACSAFAAAGDPVLTEQFLANCAEANELHGNLIESFPSTLSGETAYPSAYGGAYINALGNLVVLLTDLSQKQILSTVDTDKVTVEQTTYAYYELKDVLDQITNFSDANPGVLERLGVVFYCTRQTENCVKVSMLNMTDAKIAEFKELVSDSPAIQFENVESYSYSEGPLIEPVYDEAVEEQPQNRQATVLQIGSKINVAAGTGQAATGSIGVKATRNNINGFIASAHVCDSDGTTVRRGQTATAVGTVQGFADTATVDACFVALNANHMVVNTLPSGKTITRASSGLAAEGSPVFKTGAATGESSGYIISTDAISQSESARDMIACDIYSQGGDSGGPFYIPYAGDYALIGILKGSASVEGVTRKIVCKWSNIQSALGAQFVN